MKIAATLIVAALLAAPVSAQPIHGQPQKAFYASPAEWPKRDAQCHDDPGNNNPQPTPPLIETGIALLNPRIGHGSHLACAVPEYAEISGPFAVNCTIQLFHVAGVVSGVYSPLEQIRDIVYEDTGTSIPPIMRGIPNSMMPQKWNVSFIFDPNLVRQTFPKQFTTKHGWYSALIDTWTRFDNGDGNQTERIFPLYSMLDPTAPETRMSDEGLPNGTRCSPNNLRRPELSASGNQMGTIVAESTTFLPLGPIADKWHFSFYPYNYAELEGAPDPTFRFPNGTFEIRHDMDVHGGKVGVLTDSGTLDGMSASDQRTPITINPADLGSGTHKETLLWQQKDGQGNNYTALLAFDVTVGPGVPVPTLCTDDKATNKGQPLPCVFPPPVLPNTWDVFTPIFRVNSLDPTKMQICRTADPLTCKELVK